MIWVYTLHRNTYSTYSYTLVADDIYESKMEMLMRELICQRLHQGFQLYLPILAQEQQVGKKKVYLSMANQYHILSFDTINTSSIIVDRYIPKLDAKSNQAQTMQVYPYHYLLWNNMANTFDFHTMKHTSFRSQKGNDYKWNTLDNSILGYDILVPHLRIRSVQFHILAKNQQSDFAKLKDLICDKSTLKLAPGQSMQVMIGYVPEDSPVGNVCHCKLEVKKQQDAIERYEWIQLAHKENYHSSEAFYFQIQWLVCNGAAVSEFIQALSRRIGSLGFTLFQTPIMFDMVWFCNL